MTVVFTEEARNPRRFIHVFEVVMVTRGEDHHMLQALLGCFSEVIETKLAVDARQ